MVDASAMTQVADVLEARKKVPKFVVLSAMGGATDALLQAEELPASVADLHTCLANADADCLAHGV